MESFARLVLWRTRSTGDIPGSDEIGAGRSPDSRQSHPATGDDHPRRWDRLYGRIRTMRSSLQLGSSDAPRKRTLRRMRTFASVSRRSYEMTSLKGKPLDHLARLGGYNLLALPADFAPTKLRLPVCFVAIITYLGCFGRNPQFSTKDTLSGSNYLLIDVILQLPLYEMSSSIPAIRR